MHTLATVEKRVRTAAHAAYAETYSFHPPSLQLSSSEVRSAALKTCSHPST